MHQGSCHCGAITLTLPSTPEVATSCNCSLCRRIGGPWVFFAFGTVEITGHPEHTSEYVQGDRTLRTFRCRTCGCVTHWEPIDGKVGTRHGVHLGNFDPALIASIRVRQFDGADTWKFFDELPESNADASVPIIAAAATDVEPAVDCLASAFANDRITGFVLDAGPGYRDRVKEFMRLLMGARIALAMPVLVARGASALQGAVMGYTTARPAWPARFAEGWQRLAQSTPGFDARMAIYDGVAEEFKPTEPHYYLGVIGVDPSVRGQGIGARLLTAFCALSAADPLSRGVYLETANPANVRFYERAGFVVTGQGKLGDADLWCMFLRHGSKP